MSNGKILIVDDEEDINEVLKDYLGMKGYDDVMTLTTGREALAYIDTDKPDVAFLDIQLADNVDGMQVLEKGRITSPDTKFIMMSAFKEEHGIRANELGSYAFLGKPVKVSRIKDILKVVMT